MPVLQQLALVNMPVMVVDPQEVPSDPTPALEKDWAPCGEELLLPPLPGMGQALPVSTQAPSVPR